MTFRDVLDSRNLLMHLACVLGMIFPLSELSAWKGRESQLPRKKHGPNALKAFSKGSLYWALVLHSPGGIRSVGAGS